MPAIAALLVNDEALRSAIAFVLEIEGIAVRLHENASDLLADRSLPLDCIVIDMEPSGIDPVTCLEWLRDAGILEQAIILASNPSRRMKSRIADAGAILVEKPLLSDALTATIRRLCSRAGTTDE